MIKRLLIGIAGLAFLLVVGFVGMFTYVNYSAGKSLEAARVPASGQVLGSTSADLTVVEFADYTCAYCPVTHRNLMDAVTAEEDTKLVIRPLDWLAEFNPESEEIARFVVASGLQGKDAELHNRIMNEPRIPGIARVKEIAKTLGVDVAKAETDAKSQAVRDLLDENSDYASSLGFRGIPALVIGNRPYMPPGEEMPGVNEFRILIGEARERLRQKSLSPSETQEN
jgi:protein-disulfide isomerase